MGPGAGQSLGRLPGWLPPRSLLLRAVPEGAGGKGSGAESLRSYSPFRQARYLCGARLQRGGRRAPRGRCPAPAESPSHLGVS